MARCDRYVWNGGRMLVGGEGVSSVDLRGGACAKAGWRSMATSGGMRGACEGRPAKMVGATAGGWVGASSLEAEGEAATPL